MAAPRFISPPSFKKASFLAFCMTAQLALADVPQAYNITEIGSLGGYSVPHSIDES